MKADNQSQLKVFLLSIFELRRQYFSQVLFFSLLWVASSFLDYRLSTHSLRIMVLLSSLPCLFLYFRFVFLSSSFVSTFFSLFSFLVLDCSFANLRLIAELCRLGDLEAKREWFSV